MNKPLVIAGVAVGAPAVLLVAAFVALSVIFPSSRIEALVVPSVERALGRPVSIQGTGISVFPGPGVRLDGVSIGNTKRTAFAERPFVTVERLVVRVRLLPLLRGKAVIRAIVLDRPDVLIEVDADGSYNFDDVAVLRDGKSREGGTGGLPMLPLPLTLESFRIRRGSVHYRNMKQGRVIGIGRIDQRIDLDIDRALSEIVSTGELTLRDITVRTAEAPTEIEGVTLGLTHEMRVNPTEGTAAVSSLRISLQHLAFELSGSVRGLTDKPEVDLTLCSDTIAVRDILAEVPHALVPAVGSLTGQGVVVVNMRVAGRVTDGRKPSVNGGLALRNVSVRHADFPRSVKELSGMVSFSEERLSIEQLEAKVGENPVALRGVIEGFDEPRMDMSLKTSLNLDDVKEIVALPEGVEVGGTIGADVRARGGIDLRDPARMRLDGTVELEKVRVVAPALIHPVVAEGTTELAAGDIDNELAVTIGKSSMRIDADVRDFLGLVPVGSVKDRPRTKVRFRVSSPMLDLDDMLVADVEGPTDAAGRTRSSEPALLLASPLPRVDVRGSIACDTFVGNGVTLTDMRARVTHENDIADVSYDADLYGGSVDVDVHVDVRDNRNIAFEAEVEMDEVRLNRFVSTYNDRLPATRPLLRLLRTTDDVFYGRLSLESEFSGRGGTTEQIVRTVRGSVSASAEDGRIATCGLLRRTAKAVEKFYRMDDLRFRALRTSMRVGEQCVYLDELELESRDIGEMQASGKIGFDASYDVRVRNRLPGPVSEKIVASENTLRSAGKGLVRRHIANDKLAAAAGDLLDRTLVPTDRHGRVTLRLAMRGNGSEPRVVFQGFAGGEERSGQSPDQAAGDREGAVGNASGQAGKRAGEDANEEAADLGRKAKELLRGLF